MIPPISTDSFYLVLDQGGHATRALLFDQQGNVLHHTARDVSVQQPQEYRVEQDPGEIIQSLHDVLGQMSYWLGDRVSQVEAAALVTQRSSAVCWDCETGKALSPILSWQDRRAGALVESLQPREDAIHRKTGLRLSPHYGASKLHWCLHHLAAVQQASSERSLCWGPVASFFLRQLLDEQPHLVDPVNASRTLLWNLQSGDWDAELLQWFELPADPLPHCVPNLYHFGHLPCDAHRVPLELVSGDQSAALFADGMPQADTLYINVGTGAFVLRVSSQPPEHNTALLGSVVYRDPETSLYALEGTVNGCGSALSWAWEQLQQEPDWPQLQQWLQTISEPPLFINAISGLGSPYWRPQLESGFIGEPDAAGRLVAIVESIVFLLAVNASLIQGSDRGINRIRISGGLSQLDGLCQRLADITGLAVHRAAETEATARGAAFLLMHRPAGWPAGATSKIFQARDNPGLLSRYKTWQQELQHRLDFR